jgi:uncharacterized 2Fe-2S/4Fe-4S cluster protein (DUF4445 family)
MPRIVLTPGGRQWDTPAGSSLADALFAAGVEFPCGSRGRCRGCRVRVAAGTAPIHAEDADCFSPAELAAGWRLACRLRAESDLTLEVGQWQAVILGDDSHARLDPRTGCGIAIDLGSTTLAAQLVDRRTGAVLATRTALNPQARHGADLMSRIALACAGQANLLRSAVLDALAVLVSQLSAEAPQPVERIAVVGNTVMHHLFCGIDCAPLAGHPFRPVDDGLKRFAAAELGWPGAAEVVFLPCLGGFVGSDILAGIVACGLDAAAQPTALIDLGTNGEIAVAGPAGLVVASTAAGPAFEGAAISCGMRAATGAIHAVQAADGGLACQVIGGGPPRGVCGSGLVAAVAAGLDLGRIAPRGRAPGGLPLADGVALTQQDIRELQLAKAAIAAGLHLCCVAAGTTVDGLAAIHLAGAFGNAVGVDGAVRIGLLPGPAARIRPAGNSALRGARIALNADDPGAGGLLPRIRHHGLRDDPAFPDAYTDAMAFPSP